MQTTDTPDGLQVTLDHPDLSRKILSFRVTMRGCRGTPDPSGVQVLFEEGRANPAFDKSSHWAEFRMPGARDDNSALDISAPLRVAGQSGLTEPAIGRSYTLNAQLYNRGPPIPDVTIEVTASGQIQLGTTGMHNVPGVWPTLTENNEIGLTCPTLTPQRYVCRLPSYPGGMPARTLQVGFTPVGSSSGAGSITLQAYGPTLTRQYNSVTLPVTFDAASTADRAITALGWSPAVPAGRDLSRSEFMSLPAHRAEVTVTNRGPAAISGWEVAVEVGSTPAPYGLFWQMAAGDTLPAGCAPASLQDANQSRSRIIVRCGMPQELPAGASVSFSIPVRIVDVVPAVNAAPDWPRCPDQTMGCYPPGLALIASFSRKGAPDLDPDRLNDTFPRTEINASNQSLFTRPIEARVCGGSWSLNGVTPRGSFASLRCNP
jgi:hypothetical protein